MGRKQKMKLIQLATAAFAATSTNNELLDLINAPLDLDECNNAGMCPRNYQPICASNGVTFGNECTFRAAKCQMPELEVVNFGTCCIEKLCPREFRPVCGSDKKIHANPCLFEYAQCISETPLDIMPDQFCQEKMDLIEQVQLKTANKNKRSKRKN